jgi:putative holliday junction resolvase
MIVAALGLDIGRKRVGIAGCDGLGWMATGLATMKRSSFVQDVAQLRSWIEQRQATILVVGLPLNSDGTMSPQAEQIQKYAQRLSVALNLPVEYVNEYLSSVEAEDLLRDRGISPSRNKAEIDRKAAELILQRWLDRSKSPTNDVPTGS